MDAAFNPKSQPLPPAAQLIEASQELKLVADGPLAQMFASALQKLYAKETDPETGIVLESQALDQENYENLWVANKYISHNQDVGMLYAVRHHDLTLKDVERVAMAIEAMTDSEKRKSCVVAITDERDAATGMQFRQYHYSNGWGDEHDALRSHDQDWGVRTYRACNIANDSLKALCDKNNVGYCQSLDEYVQWVKKEVARAEAVC